ncbi:hypothetical protein HS7_15190 [Sulfolobales archaeon HS-7]|nr:hypothetical protein HS7_15190 [Sulfolobales archaeon HS-7]
MVMTSVNLIIRENNEVIEKIVESVTNSADSSMEIVVIQKGTKGASIRGINAYRFEGSMGQARSYALMKSNGKYIISLSDRLLYKDLTSLEQIYSGKFDGYGVKVGNSSFFLVTQRALLQSLGFRDLDYLDDWDILFRLTDMNRLLFITEQDYVSGQIENEINLPKRSGLFKRKNVFLDSAGLPQDSSTEQILKELVKGADKDYKCTRFLDDFPAKYNLPLAYRYYYNMIRLEYFRTMNPLFKESMDLVMKDYEKGLGQ